MPAATDIELLVGFLEHFGNFGIAFAALEEAVEINRTPALGEGDMLFRCQFLIAKEQRAVIEKRAANVGKLLVAQGGDIDILDDRTHRLAGF